MEAWKVPLIIGVCAGLVVRVMSLWPGFPPSREWRMRARVGFWLAFAALTAFLSVFAYVMWELGERAAA